MFSMAEAGELETSVRLCQTPRLKQCPLVAAKQVMTQAGSTFQPYLADPGGDGLLMGSPSSLTLQTRVGMGC